MCSSDLADVHAKDNGGETPLHDASSSGHGEVAKLLLSEGADVHAKNEYGQTPLHYASRNGRGDVAKFLLSKGADVHAKNNYGETPLDVAINSAITKLLKSTLNKQSGMIFAEISGGEIDSNTLNTFIDNKSSITSKPTSSCILMENSSAIGMNMPSALTSDPSPVSPPQQYCQLEQAIKSGDWAAAGAVAAALVGQSASSNIGSSAADAGNIAVFSQSAIKHWHLSQTKSGNA